MLDYGQVKDLPDNLRLGYANLVLAIVDDDAVKASDSYRYSIILMWIGSCAPCDLAVSFPIRKEELGLQLGSTQWCR